MIVDILGRVAIPKQIRERFGWEKGTKLDHYLFSEGRLIIQRSGCTFCKSIEVDRTIDGFRICSRCFRRILATRK